MRHLSNISERTWFWVTLGVFACIYASITFVNHYYFRTYALDLGINNNAIYDYAHFRWNDCMLLQPQFDNVLSDHFTLLPVLLSPLYWLFGTYTMLIVQWVAILLGGYGIYTYAKYKTINTYLPVLAMAHFFAIWGIYSALAFDYHDNVIAAMLVPWLFYFFNKQQWRYVAIIFTLILISKENMALWMAFLAPALGLLYVKNKKMMWAGMGMGVLAAAYFVIVVKLVIPALATPGRSYLHYNYAALGGNFSEAFITLATQPLYAIKLLFINHTGNALYDGIKPELHLMVVLAGGWALFYRPQYLLMLLPIYAQKLYSDDFTKWGINMHYSIEFVPVIALAVLAFLLRIENSKTVLRIAAVVVVLAFASTLWKLDSRVSKWYTSSQGSFYSAPHYMQRDFDVNELHSQLKLIPPTAKVSAMSFVVPHVAFRDYIYLYPATFDADYVVLVANRQNTYPLANFNAVQDSINAYKNKPGWQVVYNAPNTLLAKRK